jgi:hypothetical protein
MEIDNKYLNLASMDCVLQSPEKIDKLISSSTHARTEDEKRTELTLWIRTWITIPFDYFTYLINTK